MTKGTTTGDTRSLSDWLSLAALVICWGSAFAIIKVALVSITPIWTVSLRTMVGVIFLLPFFFAGGHRLPRESKFWLWMVLVSVVGTALPFYLISWGTQFVESGVVGILIGAVPLFTIAMAHIAVPGERANFAKVLGFVTGFAGLVVLVGENATGGFSGSNMAFYGQLAIVAAALGYAFQGICAKIMPPASTWQKTMAGLLVSLPPTFAMSFLSGTDGIAGATWQSLLAVVGLGTLSTAVAGIIMFRLIARTGPSFTSLTSYLIPVYALVLGAVLFGETAGANTLVGLALILGGIAISEFWTRFRVSKVHKPTQSD